MPAFRDTPLLRRGMERSIGHEVMNFVIRAGGAPVNWGTCNCGWKITGGRARVHKFTTLHLLTVRADPIETQRISGPLKGPGY